MDDDTQAFMLKLGKSLGVSDRDYTNELVELKTAVHAVARAIYDSSGELKTAVKVSLENVTLRALQEENAKLAAALAERDARFYKVLLLLKDLATPCIGCKKGAWAPHTEACAWAHTTDQLMELLRPPSIGSAGDDEDDS